MEMTKVVKKTMHDIINDLTHENYEKQREQINRLFTLFSEVLELIPQNIVEDVDNKSTVPSISTVSNNILESPNQTFLNKKLMYLIAPLDLKSLVGTLTADKKTIRVPERVIRKFNLVHGDIVKAYFADADRLVFEKIADSTSEDTHIRYMVERGIVSNEVLDNGLVVSKYLHNKNEHTIKLRTNEEIPHVFLISDYERRKFNLQPGDLVDITYLPDNPKQHKIVWKH